MQKFGQADNHSLLRWFDYLAVVRPMLLLPVWTQVILGYYHAVLQQDPLSAVIPIWRPPTQLVETLVLYSLLVAGCYIVNQISDRETDAVNQKLYLVADGLVKISIITVAAVLLISSGLLWAIARFSGRNPILLALIVSSAVFGLIYSLPPIRLKGKPIFDLLANAVGYGGIAFWVGWTSTASFSMEAVTQSLPYILCVASAFINTTLPDITGDQANGDLTTGALLGKRKAGQLSLAVLLLSIISAYWLQSWFALVTTLVCLPFFVRMNLLLSSQDRSETIFSDADPEQPNAEVNAIVFSTRIGILTFSVIVSVLLPIYAVLFIGIILLLRWYYATRFGIKYP